MKVLRMILAIIIAFGIGFAVGHIDFGTDDVDSTYILGVVSENIQEMSELVSLEYNYTDVATMSGDNGLKAFGKKIPFTEKSMIVRYEGVIKAGPDVSKGNVQMEFKGDTLSVTIPRSKVISHEILEDKYEILDVNNGLFNNVTPQDVSDFRTEQKAEMEANALQKGILDQADENAKERITAMINSLYPEVPVTVTVK